MSKGKAVVGGIVALPEETARCTVLIGPDGAIDAVVRPDYAFSHEAYELVDASGCYVVPGGIDAHVHLVGGYGPKETRPADDCFTGTLAALAGGTTTIIDYVSSSSTNRESASESIQIMLERAKNCACDYAFQYSFTVRYAEELRELDTMIRAGITNFKAFTYYDDTKLNRGEIMEIMQAVRDVGMLKVHCEAPEIIDICERRMDESGRNEIVCHSLTRPNIAELLSVRDMMALHKLTGTELCIAHVSARETMDEKRRERAMGDDFVIETCPHYMAFTRERMQEEDGVRYTMAPPLRAREDTEAIWQGALDGTVDFISTDHCPYWEYKKLASRDNYHTVPYGVDGIQTRMHYIFSEGVCKRGMSLRRFAQITAENTAKKYRMYPQKGRIGAGSDADLVIIDPNETWTYDKSQIVGDCDYSIFEGFRFQGRIKKVIARGELVFDRGSLHAVQGRGKFVPCARKNARE